MSNNLAQVLDKLVSGVAKHRYQTAIEVMQALNLTNTKTTPIIINPPQGAAPTPQYPSIIQIQSFAFETATLNVNKSVGFFGIRSKYEINHIGTKADFFKEDLGNGVVLEMVAIANGSFMMGTEDEEIERLVQKFRRDWFIKEKPQHQVTIQSFFMGKYPVTQAQYRRVAALPKVKHYLQANPSNFKGDNRPVEQVSWNDAVEFCDRLSKYTNKQYRLPSEAEWEYAARGGTTSRFHFGETITTELANYNTGHTYAYAYGSKGAYRQQTTDVGTFPPNPFGLYDVHGNVREWCADTWHDNYQGALNHGSASINGNNKYRLLRGGSWRDASVYCRCAYRFNNYPVSKYDFYGFRVVCGSAPATTI